MQVFEKFHKGLILLYVFNVKMFLFRWHVASATIPFFQQAPVTSNAVRHLY